MLDNNNYNSGYVCYCPRLGHTNGIVLLWEDSTVVSYDCDYDKEKCNPKCKLIEEFPIGFSRKPT